MRGASGRAAMASLEFTAKDATELVGVTVRTLRHYQQLGLIPEPRRTPRGLIYDAEHVLRLLQIKRLTAMSLSLDEVADIIADPSSSRATRILIQLDQALADRVAEIQSQRRAISESLQTNTLSISCPSSPATWRPCDASAGNAQTLPIRRWLNWLPASATSQPRVR